MFPTIAISFEGDDADRAALRELARRHKKTVGKLVSEAVQLAYGNELAELRPFFVAQGVSSRKQPTPVGK